MKSNKTNVYANDVMQYQLIAGLEGCSQVCFVVTPYV